MRDSEAWLAAVHRVLKSRCDWVTEQQLPGLSLSVWSREPPPEGLGRPPVAIGSSACSPSGPEFFSLEGILTLNSGSSVEFSHSVVSDSLWPHGLQHARPPCPPPTPGVYSISCPSSR